MNRVVSTDFHDYISVYVAIVVLFSAALFTFLLPKLFEYFNNANYRRYKELLDLRKSLVDNHRPVDRRIDKFIEHYEAKFIEERYHSISTPIKGGFYWSGIKLLGFIFIVMITILGLAMAVYQYLFLGLFVR